jgi:hypothetical protein
MHLLLKFQLKNNNKCDKLPQKRKELNNLDELSICIINKTARKDCEYH